MIQNIWIKHLLYFHKQPSIHYEKLNNFSRKNYEKLKLEFKTFDMSLVECFNCFWGVGAKMKKPIRLNGHRGQPLLN